MDLIDYIVLGTMVGLVLFFGYVAITSRKDIDK